MTFSENISDFIIPFIITAVLVSGLCGGYDIYEIFCEGAGEGIKITLKILPSIIGLMVAVNMMRTCGMIELLGSFLAPMLKAVGLSKELLPLVLLRPVSGSASLGITADILNSCGADSHAGRLASVIMGSTETVFYTIALFYGSAGIKDSGKTALGGMLGNLTGIFCSIIFCRLFFGT